MNPQKRKAVSPVIATVILVAVAITVAVGVSYWMGGISSQYTSFEKVEISSAWSEKETGGWNITLELKNAGSADATLNKLFINQKPINSTGYDDPDISSFDSEITTNLSESPGSTLASGDTTTIYILIPNTYYSSGTTIDVKIHSAGGMDYIKLVSLV
ncbi:type IV pilin [Candidatus Bathyarchaeota archaeon]|nr:type IV pilin [Candidatus Bathyarchaeota archaeon]